MEITFLPRRTRVWFSIDDLHEMPNPGTGNLFKITIPRVTIHGEDGDLGRQVINFVAESTELYTSGNRIALQSTEVEFRDKTPEEILRWCLAGSANVARVDQDLHTLEVWEPPTLMERVRKWWREIEVEISAWRHWGHKPL